MGKSTRSLRIFLLITWMSLLSMVVFAQGEKQPLEILHAEVLTFEKTPAGSLRKMIGNVQFLHDSTTMYCDSAIQNVDANTIEAFSNVKIVMPQATITADRLRYDANTRIAELFDNITLTDGKSSLTTDRMVYDRNKNTGRYYDSGTLSDAANRLTSETGIYHTSEKLAYFSKQVKLENPSYILFTDTLGYNTETETAIFLDSTLIFMERDTLFTERGFYDTKNKKAFFSLNPAVSDTTYKLQGDTLYYEESLEWGRATGHVHLQKHDGTLEILGNYGEFFRVRNETFVTGSPELIERMADDTLHLFADTLFAVNDSLNENRELRAWHNVRLVMRELQAITDSLIYDMQDSLIIFFNDPVLWNDQNQMSGDTVRIWLKDREIDSMLVSGHSFVISQEDSIGFNQIKGKKLTAFFEKGKIYRLMVAGNSESIYFSKDESGKRQGMNKSFSLRTELYFRDNKPIRIKFLEKPDATFFPMHEVDQEKSLLEGFRWRIEERPQLVKPEIEVTRPGTE